MPRPISTSRAISSSLRLGLRPQLGRNVARDGRPGRRIGHYLGRLRADLAPHDLARHLRDEERVGRHLAADDGDAEAVARVDRDRRAVARDRVEREHHARDARVDHVLDGDAHAAARDSVRLAIGDGLRVVEARPAAANAVQHGLEPADPEVGVLDAGEARVRHVLGDRARAHGDRRIGAAARRPARRRPRPPRRPMSSRS